MRIVMNPLLTLLAVRALADKQRACPYSSTIKRVGRTVREWKGDTTTSGSRQTQKRPEHADRGRAFLHDRVKQHNYKGGQRWQHSILVKHRRRHVQHCAATLTGAWNSCLHAGSLRHALAQPMSSIPRSQSRTTQTSMDFTGCSMPKPVMLASMTERLNSSVVWQDCDPAM